MAQERLSMRNTREILRLKWECKLPNRAVARSCQVGVEPAFRKWSSFEGQRMGMGQEGWW